MTKTAKNRSVENNGLSDVGCCFKGCNTVVWRASGSGLAPVESSVTCTQCRRIVFCLPHFVELYRGHQRYACPLCGAAEWWINRFEHDELEFQLVDTEAKRKQIQDETVIGQPSPLLSDGPASIPPALPDVLDRPSPVYEWRVMTQSDLPHGFDMIGRGFAASQLDGVTRLLSNGAPWSLSVREPIEFGSIDRAGQRAILGTARADGSSGRLICCSQDGSHLSLVPPKQAEFGGPCFLGGGRFAYLLRSANQELALYEGNYEASGRIRTRRVCTVGFPIPGPMRLVPQPGTQSVVTVRRGSVGSELVTVSLINGNISVEAKLDAPPRRVAAARFGTTVAWIGIDGSVYRAERGAGALIGQSDEGPLSISDDGDQIAWLYRQRLEVIRLSSGTAHQQPVDKEVVDLIWVGPAAQ